MCRNFDMAKLNKLCFWEVLFIVDRRLDELKKFSANISGKNVSKADGTLTLSLLPMKFL